MIEIDEFKLQKSGALLLPILSIMLLIINYHNANPFFNPIQVNWILFAIFSIEHLFFVRKYKEGRSYSWGIGLWVMVLIFALFHLTQRNLFTYGDFFDSFFGIWAVPFWIILIYFIDTWAKIILEKHKKNKYAKQIEGEIRKSIWKEVDRDVKEILTKLFTLVIVVLFIVLYITLPIKCSNVIYDWTEDVVSFVDLNINSGEKVVNTNQNQENVKNEENITNVGENGNTDQEKKDTKMQILYKYTIFCIALLSAIVLVFILLFNMINDLVDRFLGRNSCKTGLRAFFNEYSTPLSILIVAGALASVSFGDISSLEDNLPDFFRNLIIIILYILLFLVAIDAVRLIIKQCTANGSLLRSSMHMSFILIIKNLMDIVLDVLMNFNYDNMVSDISDSVGDTNYAKIYKKMKKTLNKALMTELNIIKKNMRIVNGNERANSPFDKSVRKFYSTGWNKRR